MADGHTIDPMLASESVLWGPDSSGGPVAFLPVWWRRYRDTTVSFMTAPDGAAGLGEALHAEAVRLGAGGEAVERYLTLHHTLALLPPPHRVSTSLHHHHGGQHPVHDGKAQSSSKWWPRWLETLPSHHSPTHPHGLVGGDEAELRVQGGGAGQALVVVHSLPERVGQLRGEQQQGGR